MHTCVFMISHFLSTNIVQHAIVNHNSSLENLGCDHTVQIVLVVQSMIVNKSQDF